MRVSTPRDVYGQRYHPYRRDFPYRPEAFTDIGEHGYGGPSLTRCFELRSAQHREGLRLPYDGLGSISTLVLSPIDRDEDVANIDTAVHESGGYSNTEAHGQKVRIRRRSLSSVVIDLALAFRAKCRL